MKATHKSTGVLRASSSAIAMTPIALDSKRHGPIAQAWWTSLNAEEQQHARERFGKSATVDELWLGARLRNTENSFVGIADLAHRLDLELRNAPAFPESDDLENERFWLLFERLRDAMRMIGYLADLGVAQLVGGVAPICMRSGATDWLTMPVFDRKVSAAVERHGPA